MALTWLDDVSLDVSEYYDVCMTSDGDDVWQDIQVAHVTVDDHTRFSSFVDRQTTRPTWWRV